MRKFTQEARRRHELEAARLVNPDMTSTTITPPPPVRRGRATRKDKQDPDIPFGVRAIESGVEVEGVWISRGTSPASTPPGGHSPAADSTTVESGDAVRRSQVPSIVMPEPVIPYPGANARASQSDGNHAPVAETSAAANHRRTLSPSESPGLEAGPRRPRPSYKPRHASGLRFSATEPDAGADRASHGHVPDANASGASSGPSAASSARSSHDTDAGAAALRTASHANPTDPTSPNMPAHYAPHRPSSGGPAPPVARSAVDLLPFTHDSRISTHEASSQSQALPQCANASEGRVPSGRRSMRCGTNESMTGTYICLTRPPSQRRE